MHPASADVLPEWLSLNNLIFVFYQFFGWLVLLASEIFKWAADAALFANIMNQGAIYEVWLVVRDFCNIFFILVLLFSALATIFQLDKYEYKKTIPLLIVMALLVNFSFPISRFVIDLANVPMYFFAKNVFSNQQDASFSQINSGILGKSGMENILLPGSINNLGEKDYKTINNLGRTHLIAATVCMFLFGISFLVLAMLMLIRVVALAILVMFSPIGFVGMITPALHKFATEWWGKLFKWAFFGPIAVMFMLVAIVFMTAVKNSQTIQAGEAVFQSTGNTVDNSMLAAVAFFSIPIILFWIAITSAEKYSNDMSGLGIKWGSQLGRWMGRRGWYMPVSYPLYRSGVTGGVKQTWKDWMGGFDESRERRERWVAGKFGGDRAKTRVDQENKKLVDEASKKKNIVDLSPDELKNIVKSGTKHEKVAALTELAGRGLATRTDLNDVRKIFGVNSQVTRAFEAKMRAFDPVSVFTDVNGTLNKGRLESFAGSGQIDWKKISDKSLTPELLQYAFKAKTISNKDVEEIRAKGGAYVSQIGKALDGAIQKITDDIKSGELTGLDSSGSVVNGRGKTSDDINNSLGEFEVLRNAQMAYLAQKGEFHSSVNANDVAKIAMIERSDGETLKRIKSTTLSVANPITGKTNANLLVENIKGKYVDVVSKMAETGNEGLANAQLIKMEVAARAGTGNTNIDRLNGLNNDHRIRYI